MGIIIKQSIQNTLSTYVGFAVGALNTLFLYTHFLTPEYYGLVGFLLSAAVVLMPLMAFGIHNTLIKFYHTYAEDSEQNRFLTWMLVLPLFVIIPLGLVGCWFQDSILSFLSEENYITPRYMWYIYWVAGFMAYFEVFYSWARVHMKSVFGNFMKEVFHRVAITLLLMAVYLKFISVEKFIFLVVIVYAVRMMIMLVYAFSVRLPKFSLVFPTDLKKIIRYSSLIVIAGSISIILLDIDKVMIGKYLAIENVAFYNVAIFIATVIVVPARAMSQITTPITARLISDKQWSDLAILYKKTSLTLFIISGWIFLLVIGNIKQLYLLIDPVYSVGLYVVILISLVKLFENILGNNTAIITNSDYYIWLVILGIFLAVMTIVLNIWLIPKYGINGAAIATFSALFLYNVLKIILVYKKYRVQPFSISTCKVLLLVGIMAGGVYWLDFNLDPIFSIFLKTVILSVIYFTIIYTAQISKDISGLFNKFG